MTETLMAVFGSTVVPAILTGLAGLITLGMHRLLAKLSAKADSQAINESIATLDGFVTVAVNETEKVIVDKLKSEGKWGAPESYTAAAKAALVAAQTMTVAALPQLAAQLGTNLQSVLTSLIESKLKELETTQAKVPTENTPVK